MARFSKKYVFPLQNDQTSLRVGFLDNPVESSSANYAHAPSLCTSTLRFIFVAFAAGPFHRLHGF